MAASGPKRTVFVAGGTGYLGRSLISKLLEQGHEVRALARPGSEQKLPEGCTAVTGNALDGASFRERVRGADTWVHLVGVPRPSPLKAAQFQAVDLRSVQAAVEVAPGSGVSHFVYVSVAQPAPVMKAYIEARAQGERLIRAAGLNATFVRPWYVLGPGHRWPVALRPFYWIARHVAATAETAQRLDLVTLEQITAALLWAVNNPCRGVRIVEGPEIRRIGSLTVAAAAPSASPPACSP